MKKNVSVILSLLFICIHHSHYLSLIGSLSLPSWRLKKNWSKLDTHSLPTSNVKRELSPQVQRSIFGYAAAHLHWWSLVEWHRAAIFPLVLALATLGSVTQIGSFLFVSHHPRWPRQGRKAISCHDIADIFANKLCQCKRTITKSLIS